MTGAPPGTSPAELAAIEAATRYAITPITGDLSG